MSEEKKGRKPMKWIFCEDPDRTAKPRFEVRNESETNRIAFVFKESHARLIASAPTLLAQRDALAEALRPFGALADAMPSDLNDGMKIYGFNDADLTVGDFRRALAALAAVGRG